MRRGEVGHRKLKRIAVILERVGKPTGWHVWASDASQCAGVQAHIRRTVDRCALPGAHPCIVGDDGNGTVPATVAGRIKLHLNHITWAAVETAAKAIKPIRVKLALTNAKGKPVMASLRPDVAEWELP